MILFLILTILPYILNFRVKSLFGGYYFYGVFSKVAMNKGFYYLVKDKGWIYNSAKF